MQLRWSSSLNWLMLVSLGLLEFDSKWACFLCHAIGAPAAHGTMRYDALDW